MPVEFHSVLKMVVNHAVLLLHVCPAPIRLLFITEQKLYNVETAGQNVSS